jgi:hypothetical protein
MPAYAIVQRVPAGRPRLGLAGAGRRDEPGTSLRQGRPALEAQSAVRIEGDEADETLAGRLDALRAAFAQTTWYLFNPEGWR